MLPLFVAPFFGTKPIQRRVLVFLIGYMGSGKSSIGRGVARRLGYRFADMDVEIERRVGMSVAEFFAIQGEGAFRTKEREVLEELTREDSMVVATGGGAPCFGDNMEQMNIAGLTIYLKMAPEKLLTRLMHGQAKRPLLAGKSPDELLTYIAENLEKREPFYSRAKLVVAYDTLNDEYIARHVQLYIENHTP